jgi:hypothetical protein
MHRYHSSDRTRTIYESISIPQEQQDEHDNEYSNLVDGGVGDDLDDHVQRHHTGISISRRFRASRDE